MTDTVLSPPPNLPTLLGPILPALPSATISTEPAVGILPLLSPLLRQRVQIFSATSTEPWLRWLCYSAEKAAKLAQVVRGGGGVLEPHPVSGEVEVDWECDSETRFRRLDRETLQALTVLPGLGLSFQLVFCSDDAESAGDGSSWRVGEVSVADASSPFSQPAWYASISEAESQFQAAESSSSSSKIKNHLAVNGTRHDDFEEEEEDDDGYWDRYDATPARSPANPQTPAPTSTSRPITVYPPHSMTAANQDDDDDDDDDDEYFAQYDQVQPAMDNHDPDEEEASHHFTHHARSIQPPLGLDRIPTADKPPHDDPLLRSSAWSLADLDKSPYNTSADSAIALLHPRPESSASASSNAVAHLERSAGKQEQNEFGVKQHISRSVRSLWSLSRASGIEREEFERIVRTELDLLGMMGDQD